MVFKVEELLNVVGEDGVLKVGVGEGLLKVEILGLVRVGDLKVEVLELVMVGDLKVEMLELVGVVGVIV